MVVKCIVFVGINIAVFSENLIVNSNGRGGVSKPNYLKKEKSRTTFETTSLHGILQNCSCNPLGGGEEDRRGVK